jgi:hypothetical protein
MLLKHHKIQAAKMYNMKMARGLELRSRLRSRKRHLGTTVILRAQI